MARRKVNTVEVDEYGNPLDVDTLELMNEYIYRESKKLSDSQYPTDSERFEEAKRMFYEKHGFGTYHPSMVARTQFEEEVYPFAKGGVTAPEKFRQVMGEWKAGELTHGTTGETVPKSRQDMALAIAYSEAREIDPNYGQYAEGGEALMGDEGMYKGDEVKVLSHWKGKYDVGIIGERNNRMALVGYLLVDEADFEKNFQKFPEQMVASAGALVAGEVAKDPKKLHELSEWRDREYKRAPENVRNIKRALKAIKDPLPEKQMEDGGTLELTKKQQKDVFHLPFESAVYVPSTQDVDKTITPDEMEARIHEVKKYLAELFGGYTSSETVGGYVTREGELVNEDVTKVVSFSTEESFKKNKKKLLNQLAKWSKQWGQEAIGYEFEGDMYYVPASMKAKKGGDSAPKTKYSMEHGGSIDINKILHAYATEDVELCEKEGDMAIANTKYGTLFGDCFEENGKKVFEFNTSDFKNQYRGDREGAIRFLMGAYQVEGMKGGGEIPEGYHRMPDGTIMANSEHKAQGGAVTDIAKHIKGNRISQADLEGILGRKAKFPRENYGEYEFEKCFLIPYYRLLD